VAIAQPFLEHHVYSATLLNVEAITSKGFSYPSWPFWEVRIPYHSCV
jgi:hypothetical protein